MADGSLVRLDDRIDDLTGVLLGDNLPTGWYAVTRAAVGPGDRVAVIGLGAVGLCAVASARALGAGEIIAIDPIPSRRAVAEASGAVAIDPDDIDVAFEGSVDSAIDAAGPAAAQRLAARLVRPGGIVSIIAVQTAPTFGIDPVTAYGRNLTITAGRAPVRSLLDDLLPRVADGSLPMPAIITHPHQPLTEGPALYRRFADREEGLVKASFRP